MIRVSRIRVGVKLLQVFAIFYLILHMQAALGREIR